MSRYLHLIGVFLFLVVMSEGQAATISESVWKDGKTRITLEGEITSGDTEKLQAIIKSVNDSGRVVTSVRLNSIGGNLGEGVSLADIVRFAKILTVVPPGAQCASACFIIFAAGNEKFASYTAFVGVHGASDISGDETVQSGAATISMARIVKALGVPPTIIGKMVVTPPDRIVWLSPDDLRSMGVTMTGKPNQLSPPQELETQLPLSITPQTKASVPPAWKDLVNKAFEISSSQHGGRADFHRNCQPEFKVCNNAIFVTGKNGNLLMLRTEENLSGNTVAREFCEFNKFGDVRVCTNWDTKVTHRDMKDAKGNWSQVADE